MIPWIMQITPTIAKIPAVPANFPKKSSMLLIEPRMTPRFGLPSLIFFISSVAPSIISMDSSASTVTSTVWVLPSASVTSSVTPFSLSSFAPSRILVSVLSAFMSFFDIWSSMKSTKSQAFLFAAVLAFSIGWSHDV